MENKYHRLEEIQILCQKEGFLLNVAGKVDNIIQKGAISRSGIPLQKSGDSQSSPVFDYKPMGGKIRHLTAHTLYLLAW